MLAVASALAAQGVHPQWTFWPILIFVIGLVVIGVSLLLAKHRELKRRDAAIAGQPDPNFTGLLWRSYTWDTISLGLFVVGSVVALAMLSGTNLTHD